MPRVPPPCARSLSKAPSRCHPRARTHPGAAQHCLHLAFWAPVPQERQGPDLTQADGTAKRVSKREWIAAKLPLVSTAVFAYPGNNTEGLSAPRLAVLGWSLLPRQAPPPRRTAKGAAPKAVASRTPCACRRRESNDHHFEWVPATGAGASARAGATFPASHQPGGASSPTMREHAGMRLPAGLRCRALTRAVARPGGSPSTVGAIQ